MASAALLDWARSTPKPSVRQRAGLDQMAAAVRDVELFCDVHLKGRALEGGLAALLALIELDRTSGLDIRPLLGCLSGLLHERLLAEAGNP